MHQADQAQPAGTGMLPEGAPAEPAAGGAGRPADGPAEGTPAQGEQGAPAPAPGEQDAPAPGEHGAPAQGGLVPGATGGRLGRRVRSVLFGTVAAAGLAVVVVLALAVRGAGARPVVAAPPLRLAELGHAGGQVSLAGYAGQPVIVNFFASWCPPCKRETPLLARFYAQHHGRIKIVGIDSNDETGPALAFAAAQHVTYPIGVDPFPGNAAVRWGVGELPQTFFLNARHQVVRHIEGEVTARDLATWAAQLG